MTKNYQEMLIFFMAEAARFELAPQFYAELAV